MQLSPRLKPWRIEQLYQRTRIGILDEDKLLHIGWGLYARGEAVLAVGRAKRGEVPCPECEKTVYRQIYYRNKDTTATTTPDFVCPICATKLTWHDCRNALRNHPRCFDCSIALEWNYSNNLLSCPQCSLCGHTFTWQSWQKQYDNAFTGNLHLAESRRAAHNPRK